MCCLRDGGREQAAPAMRYAAVPTFRAKVSRTKNEGHGRQHGTRMGFLSGKNKKKTEEEEEEEEATCKSSTMEPQKAGAQDRRRCRRRGDETGCQGRKVAID